MPRGARKDEKVSALLFANGYFKDRRSFVGHGSDYIPHLYLKGVDVTRQRIAVFKRAKWQCEMRFTLKENTKRPLKRRCAAPITWESFEMDHIQGGTTGRNDDIGNLRALCAACHEIKHNREIQSAKVAELQ